MLLLIQSSTCCCVYKPVKLCCGLFAVPPLKLSPDLPLSFAGRAVSMAVPAELLYHTPFVFSVVTGTKMPWFCC